MLQQTQVATVVPFFEKFMARFPTVESLARAGEDEVLLYWAGLGYYSRARNLWKGARKVAAEGFPNTREGWLEIPGVGPYTAGAILSIALDLPEPILDGNVERVLSRIRRVSRGNAHREDNGKFKARLWRLAGVFVREAHAMDIPPSITNQALMELGATLCSVRKPKCLLCPLSEICRAREWGDAEAFPPRKKPKTWLEVREELHCVLNDRGEVLLERRKPGEWRSGLWDLIQAVPRKSECVHLGQVETRHVVTRHRVTRVTQVWRLKEGARVSADRGRGGWRVAESGLEAAGRVKSAADTVGGRAEKNVGATGTERLWVDVEHPEVALGSAVRKVLERVRDL